MSASAIRSRALRKAPNGVRVEVEADGRPAVIEASWLIGADGGRSAVRKAMGVEFEGFTWPEQFLVVSTPYDFAQHGFALNTYLADPDEWAAVFKMPGDGPPGIWRSATPCDPAASEDELLSPAIRRAEDAGAGRET